MPIFRVGFMFVFSLSFLLTNHGFSKTTSSLCKFHIFTNNKTFDKCIDLPTHNALLHYSYDPTKLTLSMAYTARPPAPHGWVSWGINPNDTGMSGSQALIAYKPHKSKTIVVYPLSIVSPSNIITGSISYNFSGLSAEESGGYITIFATWVILSGTTSINQVWQVGPVKHGKPREHELNLENLKSTMKLTLVEKPVTSPGKSIAKAPTKAPSKEPVNASGSNASPPVPPPPTQSSGAQKGALLSVITVLGAFIVCFL